MASVYLCYGLNSHGLVEPNEKKMHPHCSYGHAALMPYFHGSRHCPREKLNSSLEPYPCDSQLYISHPVLFTHIICRICLPSQGITAGSVLVQEIQEVNAIPQGRLC